MHPIRRPPTASYALPLPPVLLLGGCAAALFFGLLIGGPLDYQVLRRYCLSHPVAIASISLFFVGLAGLGIKWQRAAAERRRTGKASAALARLITDGGDVASHQRVQWLSASWLAQPTGITHSWFGQRIQRIIELQIHRGRRSQLEVDLKWLAESDADRQHESYGLLRIINWAMPMLGFLGTVLGISQTLGQLDTRMLATQQSEAMNQLTAGLYVAFDTTAIALVLTVCLMFLQFAVSRLEINLLTLIDSEASDRLIGYLASDPLDAQSSLLGPMREMAGELIETVRSLSEEQSAIWARSIAESQRQWSSWTSKTAECLETELGQRVSQALQQHVAELGKLQEEGNRQVDSRLQQWQTTLSEHARQMQGQQKELCRQTDALQQLLQSTADLRKLEDTLHESVGRIENIGRLEQAAQCIGEAVAVLGTSLERAGVIRGVPTRPRISKLHEPAENGDAAANPASRKAA